MNFLAHAYLSGDHEEVLLGNFVADSIKGRMADNYSFAFRQGVQLHRAIDAFTDSHPLVQACNKRIQPHFRKFSGVVTDIYFDHFLASGWNNYSRESLFDFTRRVYALLDKHYDLLPPRSKRIIPWMKQQDWLTGYASFDALSRVFGGMSRRTSFESGMEQAVEVLKNDYVFLEAHFHQYFPELMAFSQQFRKKMNFDSNASC